jgi:hypothetical protein
MDKNTQELLEKGEVLPLMEAFYTIQGEGFHKGKASYFIRIGGCDVGCHWCDVKESWDAQAHPLVSTEKIIGDALEYVTHISEEALQLKTPPLTLQILIENAIKHNVANEENVLKISIKNDGSDTLIVSNNLQIIDTVDSTHTGLSNLSKRFELLKKNGSYATMFNSQSDANLKK